MTSSPTRRPVRLPPPFPRLLISWFCSLFGDGLRLVALPLLASSISPTPGAVALVAAFTAAPWLLIAIPVGTLVDKMRAVAAVRWAHLLRAVATTGLVGVLLSGSQTIWLLCLFGFLLTSAETMADGGSQSLVVRMVPAASLEKANSRIAVVETIALDLAGPLLAGVMFMIAGWLPFVLSAAAFAVAALLVSTVPEPPMAQAHPEDAEPLLTRIRLGLRLLAGDGVLRTLVITVAVLSLANAAQDGVLVLYATQTLGLPESLFPTLLVAYSLGILCTAPFVDRISGRLGQGPSMMLALLVMGIAFVAMGLLHLPVVAWAGYALVGIAGVTWNVLSATRRQRRTPVRLVARTSSAFRVVAWSAVPLGNMLGGAIGEAWSVPAVFVVAGAVILVLAAVVTPAFRRPLPDLTAS